jgi:hypothetical protein
MTVLAMSTPGTSKEQTVIPGHRHVGSVRAKYKMIEVDAQLVIT